MTNRERLLAILDRKSPDRIPWIPRLQLWYNARRAEGTLPERFRGLTQREIERELRLGTPARDGKIFVERYEGMDVTTTDAPGVQTIQYVTPAGTATKRVVLDEHLTGYADSGLDLEHPIKSEDDYRIWEYVVEHTYYEPTDDAYRAYDQWVGDDGLPLVAAGDCPFHHFLLRLVGYDRAYYELADHRERVEHLLRVMTDCERERLWPVIGHSPARLILHGLHFDSQMTPPRLFRKYITPYYEELSTYLHERGKSLSFHADDDSRLILSLVKEAGFDMAECFTTAPMVSCTLAEAREAWGNDVIIWGGVPSVILEEMTTDDEFESFMRDVFHTIAPGDAFILGVADNVMPRSKIERIERITEMVEEWGSYPIHLPDVAMARGRL